MKSNKKEMMDAFHTFEVEIPLLLEDLEEILNNSINYKNTKVGFDYNSITQVSAFYLDVIHSKEEANISTEKFERIFLAYFGEAFIHHFGGNWTLCDIKLDPAYGKYVIIGWGGNEDNVRHSPDEAIAILKKENRKEKIVENFEYMKNFDNLLDDIFG
ncbi:MAG: hypothetical protein ACXVPU_11850 [Bacteroidia bacterium]